MTTDEATQTNGVPEKKQPNAGLIDNADAKEELWSVESVLQGLKERYEEHQNSPLPFFHLLERLKTTKRAGWQRFGIPLPESISDHMYRMAIITMVAPKSLETKLDMYRCIQMAVVHDMAESLVGDITPVDPVSKDEKNRREATTMDWISEALLSGYSQGMTGKRIRALWQEYEDSKTPESIFVHDVDKMELIVQMYEYERTHAPSIDLGEFCWVADRIHNPEVRNWADQAFWNRVELWKSFGKVPKWGGITPPTSKPEPLKDDE